MQVCGNKPAQVGTTLCNYETGKWEMIGAVHPPLASPCGDRPEGTTKDAICDADSGAWVEVAPQTDAEPKPAPGFKTCDAAPPNVKYPMCNVETG